MDADTRTVAEIEDGSALEISSEELDSIADTSRPFVGSWQKLVSQTNWDKGRIIFEWRTNLKESGVDNRLCSDPAWSRLVGEVTPQHVGRLRRTWERFGSVYQDYDGLFWSHFLAALDWEDAEMWLEGAVQNEWSVSKMRYQRWETLGKLKEDTPEAGDIVASSGDEGLGDSVAAIASSPDSGETVYKDDGSAIQGPLREAPDFGEESDEPAPARDPATDGDRVDIDSILADITDDIAVPFRDLRAAIIDARDNDWASVRRIDVIALVNDLRMLLRKLPKPNEESESS